MSEKSISLDSGPKKGPSRTLCGFCATSDHRKCPRDRYAADSAYGKGWTCSCEDSSHAAEPKIRKRVVR